MAPTWMTFIAWIYLGVCFLCAGLIVFDVTVNHRRQSMGVMNFVFPITALYFGPLALFFYWRRARGSAVQPSMSAISAPMVGKSDQPSTEADHGHSGHNGNNAHHAMAQMTTPEGGAASTAAIVQERPSWVTMAIEVSHCGAGCTLGDVISEFVIFGFGFTIVSRALFAEYTGDYVAALLLGILFQYFAIAPMRGPGVKDGLIAAAKADFISLTAFEIGLFGWMAIMSFVLFPSPHHLLPNSAAYWLLMQIGMIVGYCTSWPANVWLVKRGIKVPM
jgi:hypothetical protein